MPGLHGDLKHGFRVNNNPVIVYMVKTDLWQSEMDLVNSTQGQYAKKPVLPA